MVEAHLGLRPPPLNVNTTHQQGDGSHNDMFNFKLTRKAEIVYRPPPSTQKKMHCMLMLVCQIALYLWPRL